MKHVSTPIDYGVRLHQQSGTPLDDTEASSYHRLIGHLIYLTNTRPDITYVVQHLSQFVAHPSSAHQQATYRILKYLKTTPGFGLFLSTSSILQLKAISDYDWVGCIDIRRSIIGYSIYLGSSLISWKSKK